ncbi:hypothetical protein K3495_g1037 [Podosphaera aphanis]|nr:hypothetical protein K3495_g1037 [Podosphaera aphanis]
MTLFNFSRIVLIGLIPLYAAAQEQFDGLTSATPTVPKTFNTTQSLPASIQTVTITITAAPSSTPSSSKGKTGQTTAVTACHLHDGTQYCINGAGAEVKVVATALPTPLPTAYNGCHAHDTEMFCMAPDGSEVEIMEEKTTAEVAAETTKSPGRTKKCHFHAGVEHCVSADESESSKEDCGRPDRNYNVNLRIGLLFVILITSAIGVFTPIILSRLLQIRPTGIIFTFIKQFGSGIIVATAFIHLLTHAELMFANSCLGELKYESTATSIAMGGAFIAFLVDYISHRLAHWRHTKTIPMHADETDSELKCATPPNLVSLSHHTHGGITGDSPNDLMSLMILEAGIIFHSILIGITLVVAGDSIFITLFIVIIFHQIFEGLALGARIAVLSNTQISKTKLIMLPVAFSLVTPLGMAIGICVLQTFNGNDPATIIALGTLDSLSAGILMWVGLVEMWAGDWMHGDLVEADWVRTLVGFVSLISGFMLMGLLGKWA